MPARRIGERLVAEGKLSHAAVDRALGYQQLSGDRIRIGSILLAWQLIPEERLLETLAKTHGCEGVTWDTLAAAPMAAVKLLPAAVAIRLGALPYAIERGAVRIAFRDPSNLAAVDEASALIGKRIIPAIAPEVRLMQAHQKFYGRRLSPEVRAIVQKLDRQTRANRPSSTGVDFRASDVVAFERSPASHETSRLRAARPDLDAVSLERSSFEIPILSETARLELVTEGNGTLAERAALPPPPDFYTPEPSEEVLSAGGEPDPASARMGMLLPPDFDETDPRGPRNPQSLTSWIADAIGSVDGTFPSPPAAEDAASPEAAAPASPSEAREPEAAPALPAPPLFEEPVAQGMWQASQLDDQEDEGVSGMWTAGLREPVTSPAWEPRSREEIAEALFGTHLAALPRIVLLDSSKAGILGWQGRGDGVSRDRLSEILIPLRERSVFAHVERSGVPHFGTLDRELWPPAFADLLGPTPPECAVFPIRILDGVAAFLYADRLGQPMAYEDFALIARAAAWTSSALSQVFLRHRATSVG
jgi:hypothetical protein